MFELYDFLISSLTLIILMKCIIDLNVCTFVFPRMMGKFSVAFLLLMLVGVAISGPIGGK